AVPGRAHVARTGDRRGSSGHPRRPVRTRGRGVRGGRLPPGGTALGARAGGVRRPRGRGAALAHEPRRDAAARAGRRGRARERRAARAALAVARVASRPRDAQEGGRRREEAGAGGTRGGGAHDGAGKEVGGGWWRTVKVGGGYFP